MISGWWVSPFAPARLQRSAQQATWPTAGGLLEEYFPVPASGRIRWRMCLSVMWVTGNRNAQGRTSKHLGTDFQGFCNDFFATGFDKRRSLRYRWKAIACNDFPWLTTETCTSGQKALGALLCVSFKLLVDKTKGNVPIVHGFRPLAHFQGRHQCSKVHCSPNSAPAFALVFALVFVSQRSSPPPQPQPCLLLNREEAWET